MSLDLSLYLVTDPGLCGDRGVVETVREAVSGGVRVVQLRDKTATDAEIVEQLVQLSAVIAGRALLVVNDRAEAVLRARQRGARVDGVHVGQGDLAVSRARALLGPEALVGLSAHTVEQVEAVGDLPPGTVDYLGVGVIRATATKPDHPPVLGVEGFAALAAASPVPCVAIGGIGPGDVAPLRSAGAAGVAVVSQICADPDPSRAAARLRTRWHRGVVPRVLSVAGSDPSGGAGLQADLKAIAANGGYAMAVPTALTAQNTRGVSAVHVPPVEFLTAQLRSISDDVVVDAVKIGMVPNAEVIEAVVAWLDDVRPPVVVVDPVMVATSGDRLIDAEAETALRSLLVRADVVTPNLAELAVLAGRPVQGWSDALDAAHAVSADLGTAVLVKGGHLREAQAPDAWIDAGRGERYVVTAPRIATRNTHGTGCSLASALATRLADGESPRQALESSKAWLRESLRAADELRVGEGQGPVSHFAGLWGRGGTVTAPTAQEVEEQWWSGIAELRARIDALPFVREFARGGLPEERFRAYLAQDALYLREYARVLAEASRLAPTPEEQLFWAEASRVAIEEEQHLHAGWAASGPQRATAPVKATTAYVDHLRAVAFAGEYGELVAAVLPCFWLYCDLGRRLAAGEFGVAATASEHPYASWVSTYADPGFARATRTAIETVTAAAATASPAVRARMREAFVRSAEHEHDFFDADHLGG